MARLALVLVAALALVALLAPAHALMEDWMARANETEAGQHT